MLSAFGEGSSCAVYRGVLIDDVPELIVNDEQLENTDPSDITALSALVSAGSVHQLRRFDTGIFNILSHIFRNLIDLFAIGTYTPYQSLCNHGI